MSGLAAPSIPDKEFECKRICMSRIGNAIVCCACMQFLLLAVYLLLVNFSLLHPVAWISHTFSTFISPYTWLCITPLIGIVSVHGVFLAQKFLIEVRYYPTRLHKFVKTVVPKSLFLLVHCIVGYLTPWLYLKFQAHDDYKQFSYECTIAVSGLCINECYAFLVLCGMFAGFHYCVKEHFWKHTHIEFPVVQQPRFLQIRSLICTTISSSLKESFLPSLAYIMIYCAFGSAVRYRLALTFDAEVQPFYINLRLIAYTWILVSQIVANMRLMEQLFILFLTERRIFPIESDSDVTLAEALSVWRVPITQQLACMDVYTVADSARPLRRSFIYALSMPGGHPHNWQAISGECRRIIKEFTTELDASIPSVIKQNIYPTHNLLPQLASKIMVQQYNEIIGIRRMAYEVNESANQPSSPAPQNINDEVLSFLNENWVTIKRWFFALPAVSYLLVEAPEARTSFVLAAYSQRVVWSARAIAMLATHSYIEDKYGVVQSDLQAIVRLFVDLKNSLDKINAVHISGRNIDKSYVAVRNATRSCITRVVTTFADHLDDIFDDPILLRTGMVYKL